jgi:hypothetical protein
MHFQKTGTKKFSIYQERVLSSLDKLSSNYRYFLVDNADYHKTSFIGKVSDDPNYIIPTEYSKSELKEYLFIEVETHYQLDHTKGEFSKKPRFKEDCILSFTTGYGAIITDSNLLVLDVDTIDEYNELLELSPNIVENCKFKRINTDNPYRMHLYFKKPIKFETSGIIRTIKLNKQKLWISGLNKFNLRFESKKDIAHLFRNERYDYDLVGHMDEITECPPEIIDRIIERQNSVYQP